jgi:hypothetical protein
MEESVRDGEVAIDWTEAKACLTGVLGWKTVTLATSSEGGKLLKVRTLGAEGAFAADAITRAPALHDGPEKTRATRAKNARTDDEFEVAARDRSDDVRRALIMNPRAPKATVIRIFEENPRQRAHCSDRREHRQGLLQDVK